METIGNDLLILQEKMIAGQASFKDYLEKVGSMIDNHELICAPRSGDSFICRKHFGKLYLVVYPHPLIKNKISEKDLMFHFDDIMNTIYRRNDIAGIVFVNNGFLYIDRWQINKFLRTRNDPRLIQKDWGSGIPDNYRNTDILQPWEMYDNIMRGPAFNYLEKYGFEIVSRENQPDQPVNIIARENGELCYIKVMFRFINDDKMQSDVQEMLHLALQNHAKPLVLGVEIKPADVERRLKGLYLVGDSFSYTMKLMQLKRSN